MTTTDAVEVADTVLDEGTLVHHSRLGELRVVDFRETHNGEVHVRFDVLDVRANQWMWFRAFHIRAAWGDTMQPAVAEVADDRARADGGDPR
jgi:hypothetical protein